MTSFAKLFDAIHNALPLPYVHVARTRCIKHAVKNYANHKVR